MYGDRLTPKQHKLALAEIEEMFAREHQIIRRKHFRIRPNVAERAYRRGVVHGICMVLNDVIPDCVTLEEARQLLTLAIHEASKIRYRNSHVEFFDDALIVALRKISYRRTAHARR